MHDVRFRLGLMASTAGLALTISGVAAAEDAEPPPPDVTTPTPAPAPAPVSTTPPPPNAGGPAEPPSPVNVPPPPPPSRGVEVHDGFYFRVALGFGGLFGKLSVEGADEDAGESPDVSVSGFAVMSELAFGGTPAPGLVIGGGIFTSSVSTTKYEVDVGDASVSFDSNATTAGLIGPFVDIYPNPEMGLHFGGALGLGVITADEGDEDAEFYLPTDKYSGLGLGLSAQVGYEAWVADQWSLGGAARILYVRATLKPDDEDAGEDVKASLFVPGVLFTATYH